MAGDIEQKIVFLSAALNILFFKKQHLNGGDLLRHYSTKSCIYWELQYNEINRYHRVKEEWIWSCVTHRGG